ncbi:MAG: hypothetical protein J5985_02840 [Kiritimatiellae bacterium]|nr:hypothetical protein [Kiritimatiellia bacterium]
MGSSSGIASPTIGEQLEECFSVIAETPGEVVAACCVPADFSAFEGHFPGRPILPAFCIVRLCLAIAGRGRSSRPYLRTVTRSRFLAPIEPGVPFTARVSKTPVPGGGWKCRALLTSGDATAADVQFTFDQEEEGCDAAPQA